MVITFGQQFELSPYIPCTKQNTLRNEAKKHWMLGYKISTTVIGKLNSTPLSDTYIIILAQQKSAVRPRMLKMSSSAPKEKTFKLYYHNKKKPQINPILMTMQNSTLIDLDKSVDGNFEVEIDNNSNRKHREKKYKEMKTPKTAFTIVSDRVYNVKIFLTTSVHHFDSLTWIPSL